MTTRSFQGFIEESCSPSSAEEDRIQKIMESSWDGKTNDLLEGLIDHVENVQGLYQESNKHYDRSTYLVLRTDLQAVRDCFVALRRSPRLECYDQLDLFAAGGGNTADDEGFSGTGRPTKTRKGIGSAYGARRVR